jgi:hypothetical protein
MQRHFLMIRKPYIPSSMWSTGIRNFTALSSMSTRSSYATPYWLKPNSDTHNMPLGAFATPAPNDNLTGFQSWESTATTTTSVEIVEALFPSMPQGAIYNQCSDEDLDRYLFVSHADADQFLDVQAQKMAGGGGHHALVATRGN